MPMRKMSDTSITPHGRVKRNEKIDSGLAVKDGMKGTVKPATEKVRRRATGVIQDVRRMSKRYKKPGKPAMPSKPRNRKGV